MNPLLQVKLRFAKEKNTQVPGARNLRANAETSSEKLDKLISDLKTVLRFYHNSPKIVEKIMIDANYNDIIAKSNRVQVLLKPVGKAPNDCVVGARFSEAPEGEENHIITYYIDENTIQSTIQDLETAKKCNSNA